MSFSAPRARATLWLTDPGFEVPNEIRAALLSTLFGTLPIFIGGVFNTVAVAGLVSFRHPAAPFELWLALEVVLCAVRLFVLVSSLKAAKSGRSTATDLYIWLAVLWAASIGYGCFVTIRSGDWVASTLACLSAAGMVGGICFRNFGAPRLVAAMIALSLGPCALASLTSGQIILLVVAGQIPFYLFSMTKASFRLNQLLVATMRAERDNDYKASHDPLTGLANRVGLGKAFENMRQAGLTLGLIYLDLDGFKLINDTLGHASGDALLVEVADRLRSAVNENAVLSRVGGDEFVLLIPAASAAEVQLDAEAVFSAVSDRRFVVCGANVNVGGSIGVTFDAPRAKTLEMLMQEADAALYQAKSVGGGVFLADGRYKLAWQPRPDLVANSRRALSVAV